ncbi:uncharacterized protein HMPREF1541_06850 [Cyphellophora europaea CBS 101466]|uniref:Uncharacterized protein n=1 Tax=Cyphellophora europaea (strain CBS 101466) TaxID=1220924 RepID=W2RQL6_CYPE1|nr:uncharacterized protein HMPREF1541_06850 [Cyphellophora europaea CBS 101466]ETN38811.1 hypothetical protein HMPREF1541_06850 [Cyphellophora europaea CBS 101466]
MQPIVPGTTSATTCYCTQTTKRDLAAYFLVSRSRGLRCCPSYLPRMVHRQLRFRFALWNAPDDAMPAFMQGRPTTLSRNSKLSTPES